MSDLLNNSLVMLQLFYTKRVSQILCVVTILTTYYTVLGQPSITLRQPDQIQDENFISLKFKWVILPSTLQRSVEEVEIECAADIDGQQNRHSREGSEITTSITIDHLQGNQDYMCCIKVEIERRNQSERMLQNCTSILTDSITVISSTVAIAMIAVAAVLFVIMITIYVVLCIVMYTRRPKSAR